MSEFPTPLLVHILTTEATDRVFDALAAAGYGDIGRAHEVVFEHIGPGGEARLTAIAESAGITKQSMGYLVDYLEERGYVTRVADPDDGRAKLVRLTARGWKAVRAAEGSMTATDREWEAKLGERDARAFRRILERLCADSLSR
jgi:DNA-binding MarR family transcriptional regulator